MMLWLAADRSMLQPIVARSEADINTTGCEYESHSGSFSLQATAAFSGSTVVPTQQNEPMR
jgi:hypothetical protein